MEELREYSGNDKVPIVANIKARWEKLNFSLTIIGVIVIVVILVIMVIVLGAVLGQERSRNSENYQGGTGALQGSNEVHPNTTRAPEVLSSSQKPQELASSTTTRGPISTTKNPEVVTSTTKDELCEDNWCLEAAVWSQGNMNKSVNPCDNFYQYACGGYKLVNPLDVETSFHSVFNDIYQDNKKKLEEILESPVNDQDWPSERKVKDLFQACNDQFSRDLRKGYPAIELINKFLGGWSVIGSWNSSQAWNLGNMLKVVQDDLWVGIFWRFEVGMDDYIDGQYTLGILPSGIGRYMATQYYVDQSYSKIQEDYKKFMRRVAALLQRDANVTMSEAEKTAVIEEFVNDAFHVEQQISNLSLYTVGVANAAHPQNRITLGNLTAMNGGYVDWTDHVSYLFGVSSGINSSYKVVTHNLQYLQGLTSLMRDLIVNGNHRVLHNYMVWRLLEMYIQDLGWDYVHANREVFIDVTGRREFTGLYSACFDWVAQEMKEALGALFIQYYFDENDKIKVAEITEKLKEALEDAIADNKWMDAATKSVALDKARNVIYKLGYPELFADKRNIDGIYSSLVVNRSEHMANKLAINNFKKIYFRHLIMSGENRDEWTYRVFDTTFAVLFYWNEIIIPAGVFQFPFYDYRLPHAMAFGGLGSRVGRFINLIIDEYGSNFDARGTFLGSENNWWTNNTRMAYVAIRNCMADASNITQGPFSVPGFPQWYRINAPVYASEALGMSSGIRMALRGYKLWTNKKGEEKQLPGLRLTNDQVFFLSQAQSYCSNRNDLAVLSQILDGAPTDENRVNLALMEVPEFATAFNCPLGSTMNPTLKCQLY